MFDVSAATGTLNGGTPAPGSVISISSPTPAPRIVAERLAGSAHPRAAARCVEPFGRLELLHRRVGAGTPPATSRSGGCAWRTNTLADGTGSATAMPSIAFSFVEQRVVHRRGERDLRAHLLEAGGGVERRLGGVDDATGCDHADDRGRGRDGGDDRGPGAEGVVAARRAAAGRCRARAAPTSSASSSPSSATAQVVRADVLGQVHRLGELGPADRGAEEPEHDAHRPRRRAMVMASVAPPAAEVVDRARRPARRPARRRGARSSGTTMLASRKPVSSSWITPFDGCVARGCTSCAPLLLASVVSRRSRSLRSTPAS